MLTALNMRTRLNRVFSEPQAGVLTEVIQGAYIDLVKSSDFNELKAIVKEIAEVQKEIVEVQKKTAEEIQLLVKGLSETRSELGGLSRSTAYALENEAYRLLPAFLKDKYGIEITNRLVRTEVGGEEINIFSQGQRNGQPILLVGETKLQMDERRKDKKGQKEIFKQLTDKIEAVKVVHPGVEIVPLLITHYARPGVLQRAKDEGIIIVQSFEW